jgi:hypothetical protein
MATNKKIRVADLDFDEIKDNFKTFLRGQTEFTDYNFEGSALNVLLDVLAYNTHYNAIYANLVANEMFLDSASKRASVVSLAKQIGYTPESMTSAKAVVDMYVLPSGTPNSVYLPRLQPFSTVINNVPYTFYNIDSKIIVPLAGVYGFTGITLVEGTPVTNIYEVSAVPQRFILGNANIDLSTLRISVQETSSSTVAEQFIRATSINNITSTTPAFYVQETYDGLYEIIFGDGVIAKKLLPGNVVRVEYFVSSGRLANGASSFTFDGSFDVSAGISALFLQRPAAGGAERESTESIKFKAPLTYSTQNRAVTADDYKNIVLANYSDTDAINVWGGEDNDPPVYGRVFMSIKPKSGEVLTSEAKNILEREILGRKSVIGIKPEFVDPEYLYLVTASVYFYDPSKSRLTETSLSANVRSEIVRYRDENLDDFASSFRYSRFVRLIDDADRSILSNRTVVTMYKEFAVVDESPLNYRIGFGNSIIPGTIISTAIRQPGDSTDYFLQDDAVGNMLQFTVVNGERLYNSNIVGSIDYINGTISLNNFAISIATVEARIYASPRELDVAGIKNTILTIRPEDIIVTAVATNSYDSSIRSV